MESATEFPNLLRRPIITDSKHLQIGFNEDEIRAFLPREYRRAEMLRYNRLRFRQKNLLTTILSVNFC